MQGLQGSHNTGRTGNLPKKRCDMTKKHPAFKQTNDIATVSTIQLEYILTTKIFTYLTVLSEPNSAATFLKSESV